MGKKLMNRIMGTLLVLIMLITLIPSAYAEGASFLSREYYFQIRLIGLKAPKAGEKPDFNIYAPDGAEYRINKEKKEGYYNGVLWYDLDTGKYITPDSIFEEGHEYSVSINVRCSGDYVYFANICDVVTDIGIIEGRIWDNPTFMTVYKSFDRLPVKQVITQVDISDSLQKGTQLDKNTLSSSTDGVNGIETTWIHNCSTMHDDSEVTFGDYQGELTITAKDGYLFSWDTKVKVFGELRSVQTMSGDRMEIKAITPKQHFDCDHTQNENQDWKHDSADKGKDTVAHYKVCTVCGERYDEEEHTFDAGKAIGDQTTYTCTVCGYQKTVGNDNKKIDYLYINDTPMIIGDKIPSAPTFRGLGSTMATIESAKWYKNDTEVYPGNTIEEGGLYKLELQIKAKNGYYAEELCGVGTKTNSQEFSYKNSWAVISDLSNDKTSFTATFYYKPTKAITLEVKAPELIYGMTYKDVLDQIDVTAVEKDSGNRVSRNDYLYVGLLEGDSAEHMQVVMSVIRKKGSDKWYKLADKSDAAELLNTKLKQELYYKVEIGEDVGYSDYKYLEKGDISISGGNVENSSVSGSDWLYLYAVNTYHKTGDNVVNEISLSGIATPEFGKMPDTSYTIDTPYGVEKDGDLIIDTSEPYECGTQYKATVKLKAADGFEFADEPNVNWKGGGSFAENYIHDKNSIEFVILLDVIEHKYGEWQVTTPASCTEEGIETAVCENDPSHTKTRIIQPTGHKFGEYTVTKEATCTEPGEKTAVCANDPSHRDIMYTPVTEHSFSDVWSSNDEKHWKECHCGEKSEEAAHTYDAGKVTKEATVSEEGIKTYTCTVCGHVENESIAKLQAPEPTATPEPDKQQPTPTPDPSKQQPTAAPDSSNPQNQNNGQNNPQNQGSTRNTGSTNPQNSGTGTSPSTSAQNLNGTGDTAGTSNTPAAKDSIINDGQGTSYIVTSSATEPAAASYKKVSKKSKGAITIPDTVKIGGVTYKITAVNAGAFKNNKKVTKIVLGKNVVKIGSNAFTGCKNLKQIIIKSTKLTAKGVAKNAFKGIGAKVKITVPKNMKKAYIKLLRQKGLSKKVKIV